MLIWIIIGQERGNPDEDLHLLIKAQRGDMASLGALLEAHRPALRAWLLRQFHLSLDTVEDAVQQAFVQITAGVGTLHVESTFRTYLFAVARNRCLDLVRASARHPEVALEVVENRASGDSRQVDRMALRDALDRLAPPERLLVRYVYTDGLTCTDIAPLVGKSISQVTRDLKKALQKLRAELTA